MKRLFFVLGLAALLAACSTDHSSIDGTWTAAFTGTDTFNLTTSLTAVSNNGLSVTNLTFNRHINRDRSVRSVRDVQRHQ
jgi:uncharacterized lipoprotein YajG